jgi:general secretion pathway protein D
MPHPSPLSTYCSLARHTTLVLALAACGWATAQTAGTAALPTRGAPVTLNFVNAEIEAVARAMSSMTGRQVVLDPRVKGTLNLSSDKPISPTAAYNQFLGALRLQGFTVVESAGLDKVVPEADAKLQSDTVRADGGGKGSSMGNQIVTQIFKLNFENAANLLPVLRPLISPNNVINVNPGNNSLVITDYADNLQRIARIIAASDVANGSDLEILPLKYAIAGDLAPLLLRLIESGNTATPGTGQTDTSFKTTIIAEPRSNALIVRAANPARVTLVKALVARLDQPTVQGDGGTGNIHVVALKNADATKLAATLRAVMSGQVLAAAPTTSSNNSSPTASISSSTTTSGGFTATSTSSTTATTTGGQVQADVATNSLIITAPDPQYRQLRAVIDQLDARRAQVLVESLIVEVNATRAAQFGVQWQGLLGNLGGTVGLLGTNFSTGGTANLINLSTAAAGSVSPSAGMNFGIGSQTNGVYTLNLLANFLQSDADTNILSTPSLLTMDNEEAKIVVGQNVPFVTGQYTTAATGGTGSVNPFQTIERKDVGLTLKVKPQISENGTVKLTIYQEVSSVDSASSTAGLITNKRSIESNVVVQDGGIVVLGGLLDDKYSGNKDRVPGLSDIPLLGALFRSEQRSRAKTNLMVFLRPLVVRDASSSEALANQRYDQMRNLQMQGQPISSNTVPINESAIMAPGKIMQTPPTPAPATPSAQPSAQ